MPGSPYSLSQITQMPTQGKGGSNTFYKTNLLFEFLLPDPTFVSEI